MLLVKQGVKPFENAFQKGGKQKEEERKQVPQFSRWTLCIERDQQPEK